MNLNLTEQEIQILIMALGEIPLKVSGPVFSKIQAQVETQKKLDNPQDHSDKPF